MKAQLNKSLSSSDELNTLCSLLPGGQEGGRHQKLQPSSPTAGSLGDQPHILRVLLIVTSFASIQGQ